MEYLSLQIKKMLIFLLIVASNYSFSLVEVSTSATRILAVRDVVDISGNLIIQAILGASGSNPSTWVSSNISSSLNTTDSYNPQMYVNGNGDFVVLWGYLDPITGNPELACGYLLHSSSVWQVANVSQSIGAVASINYVAAFDNTTRVIICWTSTIANTIAALVSTLDLNTNTFSAPLIMTN